MEIHPDYLGRRRLGHATATEEHFRSLFACHAGRFSGSESCLNRFRSSVEALREHRTSPTLAAVEECHNELCIAEVLSS